MRIFYLTQKLVSCYAVLNMEEHVFDNHIHAVERRGCPWIEETRIVWRDGVLQRPRKLFDMQLHLSDFRGRYSRQSIQDVCRVPRSTWCVAILPPHRHLCLNYASDWDVHRYLIEVSNPDMPRVLVF
jgi:hypothetical protein